MPSYESTVQTIRDNAKDDSVSEHIAAADLWDQADGHIGNPGLMGAEALKECRQERNNCTVFLKRWGFSRVDRETIDTILEGRFDD